MVTSPCLLLRAGPVDDSASGRRTESWRRSNSLCDVVCSAASRPGQPPVSQLSLSSRRVAHSKRLPLALVPRARRRCWSCGAFGSFSGPSARSEAQARASCSPGARRGSALGLAHGTDPKALSASVGFVAAHASSTEEAEKPWS